MRCARLAIADNAIIEKREVLRLPDPNPVKGFYWLPCPAVPAPPFDPATEVRTRLADVVGPTEVVEGWDVRAKTQAELDAELEARKDAEADRIIDGMKALGKTLFLLVNDVRVLQGKQPITAAQFRQFLKDQII